MRAWDIIPGETEAYFNGTNSMGVNVGDVGLGQGLDWSNYPWTAPMNPPFSFSNAHLQVQEAQPIQFGLSKRIARVLKLTMPVTISGKTSDHSIFIGQEVKPSLTVPHGVTLNNNIVSNQPMNGLLGHANRITVQQGATTQTYHVLLGP